jgi:hypothetical protein
MPKPKNVEIYRKSSCVKKCKNRQYNSDVKYLKETMKEALEICHNGEMQNQDINEIKKRF